MKKFKPGEKVKVNFEKHDGSMHRYHGKFMEHIDIGVSQQLYGIVKISSAASVMAPIEQIERSKT